MWTVFKHECATGEWSKGQILSERVLSANANEEVADPDTFIFWDGDVPDNPEAQQQLLEQAFSANNGKLLRVVIGGTMQRVDTALTLCSGNCFCVVAHGMRRCETYWCSASGLCWWVPCGSSC